MIWPCSAHTPWKGAQSITPACGLTSFSPGWKRSNQKSTSLRRATKRKRISRYTASSSDTLTRSRNSAGSRPRT
ncbi:ORFL239C [Human betaherpesvirus 5]|nr:ORFL239C [Human betaherpesvirus 5]QHX40607.1 ORFL239C [Human betaherpesvirus 5]